MAPAKGAIAARPRSSLLDKSCMTEDLLSVTLASASSLTAPSGVALRLDMPQRHHGVVFVDHVMAMDGILPEPVSEAEEQLNALVLLQLGYILARAFDC